MRQGRVATLVWERLRDSTAVAAYLNTEDPVLGGRLLDVATADDAGLVQVISQLDVTHPLG